MKNRILIIWEKMKKFFTRDVETKPFVHPNISNIEKVDYIKQYLSVSATQLCSLLGVTHQRLAREDNLRLDNLFLYLYNLQDTITYEQLINKRVVIDPQDEEDGSVSLIGYIISLEAQMEEIPKVVYDEE